MLKKATISLIDGKKKNYMASAIDYKTECVQITYFNQHLKSECVISWPYASLKYIVVTELTAIS